MEVNKNVKEKMRRFIEILYKGPNSYVLTIHETGQAALSMPFSSMAALKEYLSTSL